MYLLVAATSFVLGVCFSVWLDTARERRQHREWLKRMQNRVKTLE